MVDRVANVAESVNVTEAVSTASTRYASVAESVTVIDAPSTSSRRIVANTETINVSERAIGRRAGPPPATPLTPWTVLYSTLLTTVRNEVELGGAMPVGYLNGNMTPPANGVWCVMSLAEESCEQITHGVVDPWYRKRGKLVLSFRLTLTQGDGSILAAVDGVRTRIGNTVSGLVHYGTPSAERHEPENGQWRIDLAIPFYSDDLATRDAAVAPWAYLTRAGAHNIVRSRFQTLAAAPLGLVTIYDNSPVGQTANVAPWCLFAVTTGDADEVGSGRGGHIVVPGHATASIFVPVNTGTLATTTLVDAIIPRFRSVVDRGVSFESPCAQTVGRSGGGWQTNVHIPFFFSEALP